MEVVVTAVGLAALPAPERLVAGRPPLTRYLSSLSRTALRTTAETSWDAPREYDVENAAGVKSAALRPTVEAGLSGCTAVSATESAKGTFFANSFRISFSSSGKLKTERQFSAFQASSGSASDAV